MIGAAAIIAGAVIALTFEPWVGASVGVAGLSYPAFAALLITKSIESGRSS